MSTKTPILPADIRKGDTIRKEYDNDAEMGESEFVVRSVEYIARKDGYDELLLHTGACYLLNRPVPPVVLPTEPGVYEGYDKLAERPLVARLLIDGRFVDSVFYEVLGDLERFAPFTRLRPEAEVAAEVLADIESNVGWATWESLDSVRAKWATN